jgi:hypothetical protein
MVALPKPPRGSHTLTREQAKREKLALERQVKAAVKHRDGRCRWPEKHKCRGELEAAHIKDASLGGELATENLFLQARGVDGGARPASETDHTGKP